MSAPTWSAVPTAQITYEGMRVTVAVTCCQEEFFVHLEACNPSGDAGADRDFCRVCGKVYRLTAQIRVEVMDNYPPQRSTP